MDACDAPCTCIHCNLFHSLSPPTELLFHAKCLDESNMPEMFRLLQVYTDFIRLIAYNTSADFILPRACCAVVMGTSLVHKGTGEMCDTKSGPATKEFIVGLVSKVAAEALDLACGQYSTMEDCKEKQSDFLDTLETIANETRSASKDIEEALKSRKSFLLQPILKIANDLTL